MRGVSVSSGEDPGQKPARTLGQAENASVTYHAYTSQTPLPSRKEQSGILAVSLEEPDFSFCIIIYQFNCVLKQTLFYLTSTGSVVATVVSLCPPRVFLLFQDHPV